MPGNRPTWPASRSWGFVTQGKSGQSRHFLKHYFKIKLKNVHNFTYFSSVFIRKEHIRYTVIYCPNDIFPWWFSSTMSVTYLCLFLIPCKHIRVPLNFTNKMLLTLTFLQTILFCAKTFRYQKNHNNPVACQDQNQEGWDHFIFCIGDKILGKF